jgi:cell division inhibitor SepF
MGVLNKIMNYIGFGEEEDDAVRDGADGASGDEASASETRRGRAAVVSIHSKATAKVVLMEARSFDDVREIVDHLRNRRAVLINLARTNKKHSQRIVDFIAGALYAINGKMEEAGDNIYLCAPENYELSGSIDVGRGSTDGAESESR